MPSPQPPPSQTALATDDGRPPLPAWARVMTRLLDDLIRIPGTEQGIGLDGLLGLIPGVGDSVTVLGASALKLLGVL